MSFNLIMRESSAFALTEMGRIVTTVVVVLITMLILKILQRRAIRKPRMGIEASHNKGNLVLLKNLILLSSVIIIGTIWASKIAGAALSLAAVAGALLIISKEFLANLLGSGYLAVSRPYRIDDFITIDGIAGRVIDTDLLATTLSEMQNGSQLTSRTVTIPHALLLVKPVTNLTSTGEFVINMLPVSVDLCADMEAHEQALLRAGQEVCHPWIITANMHFKRFEARKLMDLPSADPRVIFQHKDIKEVTMSLRYTCEPNQKVNVEQAILRLYWKYRPTPLPKKPD